MKVAIFSDTHFGFGWDSERREDSFLQCLEAFEIAARNKPDLLILPGDIFDERTPRPEVWEAAVEVFSKARHFEWKKDHARVLRKAGKPFEQVERKGGFPFPIIAIHGTHEYRTKEFKNPVEILEAAGLVVHLHGQNCVLEKEDEAGELERVAVYGLSGMPDAYVKTALEKLREQGRIALEENATNIFVIHQTFKDFIPAYDDEPGMINLSDLPEGFDLYVNGHFHWAQEIPFRDTTFLMPGSTVRTQLKKIESEVNKRVYFYDTQAKKLSFEELKTPRPFLYHDLSIQDLEPKQVLEQARAIISEFVKKPHHRKPLLRLRIRGSLAKGFKSQDLPLSILEEEFNGKAIMSISKDLASESLKEKILNLRELHKSRPSVEQLGMQLLAEELAAVGFNAEKDLPGNLDLESLFTLLSENDSEESWRLLQERLLEKKQ